MTLTNRILAGALVSMGAIAQQPPAAYVVDVKPGWVSPQGTPITLGTDVQAGEILRWPGAGSASLSVAYLDGTLDTKACPKSPCEYLVKSAVPKTSSWPEIFRALKNLASRRESMPINAISRGSDNLRPRVLLVKEDKVALQDTVVNLDAGRYTVQFKPVKMGGEVVTGSMQWDAPAMTTARVPGLTPGVYQMTLLAEEGRRIGREIVLVASAADFEGKSAAFERNRKFFDSQSTEFNPAATRNILEALLIELGN